MCFFACMRFSFSPTNNAGTWDPHPSRRVRKLRLEDARARLRQHRQDAEMRQHLEVPELRPPTPPVHLALPPVFDTHDLEDVFEYVKRVPPPAAAARLHPAASKVRYFFVTF